MDLSAGIPIAIHLETLVMQEGETTKHVFDEPGKLVQIGTTLYIRYKERDEENNDMIPVTLKIQGDGDVQLSRGSSDGQGQLRLLFSQNNRVLAKYKTPYGVFPVETVTPKLQVKIKNRPVSGEIYIEYQLFASDAHIGDYKLQLIFTA